MAQMRSSYIGSVRFEEFRLIGFVKTVIRLAREQIFNKREIKFIV